MHCGHRLRWLLSHYQFYINWAGVSNIGKRGPKTQYDSKLHPKLIGWLCRAGLTDEQIAVEIGISARQLYRWYKEYPELCEAKKQKQYADYQVEDSLYKRALGYEVEEAEVVASKDGRPVRIKKTKKHIAPDVTACIWWLKNRQPKRWINSNKDDFSNDDPVQFIDDISD